MATIFDELLLVKPEAVKGVEETPTPALNAVRIKSMEPAVTGDTIERPVVKPTMGQLAHLVGKKTIILTIEVEMKASGAAGTAPDYGPLLRACAMDETIVPATSVTYDPLTDPLESVTMFAYIDGLLWKLVGAVGTFTLNYEMNSIVGITFTISAPYLEPTTTAYPGGEVYQSSVPVVASSADVFNDGTAIKVSSFSLDAANDVQEHYTTGNHEFVVANRNPSMTLTKDSVSTIAEFTAFMSGTNIVFSAVNGVAAGSIITISVPAGRRTGVNNGKRAERYTREINYRLYESSGDDQFSIAFT